MFKRLVSGLIFSPTLAAEIEGYEKRLKQNLVGQRVSCGLVLVLLALSLVINIVAKNDISTESIPPVQAVQAQGFSISVSATNDTQKKPASQISARSKDHITYKLTSTNTSGGDEKFQFVFYIGDILEYSEVSSDGGATIDEGYIYWPESTLENKSIQERSFTTQIKNPIPVFRKNPNSQNSFDCIMSGNFGNQIDIAINCPIQKTVEKITTLLPEIDVIYTTTTLMIVLVLMILLCLRTKLLLKELSIIRKNFTSGVI